MASSEDDKSRSINSYHPTIHQPNPGYPLPYQGYGNGMPIYPDPNNNYQYPPPSYYNTSLPPNPENTNRYTFARMILCLMVFLIFATFMLSLITWIFFGPISPEFHIHTFRVTTFDFENSTTTETLKANWETTLRVKNPNNKLQVSFDSMKITLYYKDYPVIMSSVMPFTLVNEYERSFDIKLQRYPLIDNEVASSWVKDMIDDRRNGSVNYDLKIVMRATFRSGSSWSKRAILKVLCDDLKVEFPAATGGGEYISVKQDECYLVA